MSEKAKVTVFYFDLDYAIKKHEWVIKNSGGLSDIANLGQLECPLEHIKNDFYYPEIEDKLTHLVFSINKNHAFVDGNKRTSLVLGGYFLKINGFNYLVEEFVQKMENIAIWVADGTIDKTLLHKIIESIISEEDYSESLKYQIFQAISRSEMNK